MNASSLAEAANGFRSSMADDANWSDAISSNFDPQGSSRSIEDKERYVLERREDLWILTLATGETIQGPEVRPILTCLFYSLRSNWSSP